MFNWVKQTVGITDHHYGPEAVQSVVKQAEETPYTEIGKKGVVWETVDGTNVETKTFHFISDDGRVGLAQVIYSDVMGIRTTAQFSSKVFAKESGKPHHWSSDNLHDFSFSKDKQSFKAEKTSLELSEDGQSYHIKSSTNKNAVVDLVFTQAAPGFVAGKNGTTNYGTDPAKPWGRMRHAFWPRCNVSGTITTKDGPVDFKGKGVFIHALQGMKPHFAASRWNFAYFQTPTYTALQMEFTTPPSYGSTVVNIGAIAKDGEILYVGASPSTQAQHTSHKSDKDNEWPEPESVLFTWDGPSTSGKPVKAELKGSITPRTDRVDVMGELPGFVKQIATSASGTKPYIYQYTPSLQLDLHIGGEDKSESGQLFMEATFIS